MTTISCDFEDGNEDATLIANILSYRKCGDSDCFLKREVSLINVSRKAVAVYVESRNPSCANRCNDVPHLWKGEGYNRGIGWR